MHDGRSNRWIVYRTPRRSPRVRLFCLPYAGGGASTYRTWHAGLGPDVDVCPVELPGRETRFAEPSFGAILPLTHALAEGLYPFFGTPFALFGHSMGAIIAFELTRWLRRQGGPMPGHVIVSGAEPPQIQRCRRPLHRLPDEELISELAILDGTPRAVLENDELMQALLPIVRSDLAMDETYCYVPEPPLHVPLSVIGGASDPHVRADRLAEWQVLTTEAISLQIVRGGHFFVNDGATIIPLVASAIAAKRPGSDPGRIHPEERVT